MGGGGTRGDDAHNGTAKGDKPARKHGMFLLENQVEGRYVTKLCQTGPRIRPEILVYLVL